jgi:diguanylate cyclase (GGDEF)-like protein/PAS domain S-box-containing protein
MDSTLNPVSDHDAAPQGRRLVVIIWLFVGIVFCLLALSYYSIAILSAGRAYVGGEGLWSKGQKDAVYFLTRYAKFRDEPDYQAYLQAIAVPLGDHKARLELEKPDPDLRVAHEGFVQGRNHFEDIDGMIFLFRRFRHVDFMAKAIDIWSRGDAYIEELMEVGNSLHAQIGSERPDEARILALMTDLDSINGKLTPLEDEFSYTLGEAQRKTREILLSITFVAAALLLFVGVLFSRRMLCQSEAVQTALKENEAQLRKVLRAAPVPFVISRLRDGNIVFVNERALEQLRAPETTLLGQPASLYYSDPFDREEIVDKIRRDGEVREREVKLKDHRGGPFWALLSSQLLSYMNEMCVLTAFSNIDERKRTQDELHHRAYHDDLTNLSNRPMFVESLALALARARRHQSMLTVLFIDLDRFKNINDTLGHQGGDLLLRDVADRLVESVRESDLVARIGGDEFVVLIEEHRDNEVAAAIATKILRVLAEPFVLNQREVRITASMGISSYPDDGVDLHGLIKNADAAMYQAKQLGRNNFQFYSGPRKPRPDVLLKGGDLTH